MSSLCCWCNVLCGWMQMLEEEEVEVPVSATNEAQKEATKMDTDETPNDPASGNDVNMQESKSATDTAEGAENGAPTSEEKSVPMDTDAKVWFYRLQSLDLDLLH